MNLKQVRDFVILRPAFTGRNISSIGLVAIFFFVYVAAGGKITTIPKVRGGGDFGSVSNSNSLPAATTQKPAATQTAVKEAPKKPSASSRVSNLFGGSKSNTSSKSNNEIEEASANDDSAKPAGKSLDDIEARLRQLRSKEK